MCRQHPYGTERHGHNTKRNIYCWHYHAGLSTAFVNYTLDPAWFVVRGQHGRERAAHKGESLRFGTIVGRKAIDAFRCTRVWFVDPCRAACLPLHVGHMRHLVTRSTGSKISSNPCVWIGSAPDGDRTQTHSRRFSRRFGLSTCSADEQHKQRRPFPDD